MFVYGSLIGFIAVRIEWLKARARTKRWAEEVQLLEEEHRRVGVFLRHKAAWWEGLAKGH